MKKFMKALDPLDLMSETLLEEFETKISRETLRKWMADWSLWETRKLKSKRIHSYRERRESSGELVQIDGSHHAWFEKRGPKCCLIVFVDDASSKILCHFSPATWRNSLCIHGVLPWKHSVWF